jgi:hypothetical protein
MKKITLILALIISFKQNSIAQKVDSLTIWEEKPTIKISGFLDVFYVYDFNKPTTNYRQSFLYNHNRHNEFNLNLGLLKWEIKHPKYTANIAMQTGTYANDNYVAEPGLLKNIHEANIGISLNKKNSLWLNTGVLPSHIGFESAVSIDNWTLTRSLLTDNSPYYLTGVKLTFNPNTKLEIAGFVLNGWQRIQRLNGNSNPSFGTQVCYNPSEKLKMNWSTFIGTDDPDSIRRMRYFNNLYGQIQVTKKIGLIAGFDFGAQQKSKNDSNYNVWFSPVLIGQYAINKRWKTAIRAEYYQDEKGVIIPTASINGFKTTGVSWNFDYSPIPSLSWRIECRWLNSKDKIFEKNETATSNNFFIGTSLAIKFSEALKK